MKEREGVDESDLKTNRRRFKEKLSERKEE